MEKKNLTEADYVMAGLCLTRLQRRQWARRKYDVIAAKTASRQTRFGGSLAWSCATHILRQHGQHLREVNVASSTKRRRGLVFVFGRG